MVYHVTCFAKVSLLLLKSCSIRVIITFRFIIKNLAHAFNTSSAWQFYVFQDVLKTSCKDVLKTSWRPLARRLEDVLEDEILLRWIRLEHMSCRCVQDMLYLLKILWRQTKYLLGIYVYLSRDSKSKCVSNKFVFQKSISDNSKSNPKCINYWWLVWCYESSLIQIRHCRKGQTIKTNF